MATVQDYVQNGEHLPPELRDFHDQKLFFKWLVWNKLEAARKKMQEEGKDYQSGMLNGLDFASAQIFTIDYFLWFMAMFGYKLQRVRKRGMKFYDLTAAMKEYEDQLIEQQTKALTDGLAKLKAEKDQS